VTSRWKGVSLKVESVEAASGELDGAPVETCHLIDNDLAVADDLQRHEHAGRPDDVEWDAGLGCPAEVQRDRLAVECGGNEPMIGAAGNADAGAGRECRDDRELAHASSCSLA